MKHQMNFESITPEINKRLEPFMSDFISNVSEDFKSAFLIGASARGELSSSNPEIQTLFVFDKIDSNLLSSISKLGAKHGAKGIRAPLLLTTDYVKNAWDVFPVEFLDLKYNNSLIAGESLLADIEIDKSMLRLQCERELRSWNLQLNQGFIKSAGDDAWLGEWFITNVIDVFPVLRGVLYLLDGGHNEGNTEITNRLSSVTDIDLSSIVSVWEARKQNMKKPTENVRELFEVWYGAITKLIVKVDNLNV